jgi:hypothetical protein
VEVCPTDVVSLIVQPIDLPKPITPAAKSA